MQEPPLFLPHHLNLGFWDVPGLILYTWLVMGILIVLSLLVTTRLKTIPGGLQNVMEFMVGGLRDFTVNTMGPHGLDYFALIGTAAFFILFSNLIGLIPGFESPTSNLNTTAGCSVVVFVVTHIVGVRKHGFKYVKHFVGPVWWLAWLMFPIEIIGHLVRPVSLSLRLFGNIKGEDLVIAILFILAGKFLVPSAMMGMAVFTSFLQSFVFVLLTMLYIAGAMEHAH